MGFSFRLINFSIRFVASRVRARWDHHFARIEALYILGGASKQKVWSD